MRLALQARFILTAAGPPLRDASLTIDDGRVVAVGKPDGPQQDLGNVALLPAFVNPHTHLEFSDLESPLGEPGVAFVEWIRQVVAWKRLTAADGIDAAERRARATAKGIAESRNRGVKVLGEIATPPFLSDPYSSESFEGVAFLELLGLAPEYSDRLLELAQGFMGQRRGFKSGISPHAPYTVGLDLLERVVRWSQDARFPVAMHLAESVEELELLRSHSGDLVEFLKELGAWHPGALPRGNRPRDYLELLAKATRSLVIHGNYLTRDEIRFVGAHRSSMSVIYCPRTHAYFKHPRYPLADMLAAGVNVAVGTDSRASSPDLSILNELRWVARHHPEVSPADVLRLGTSNAARALGCEHQRGTLEPGKLADFVILPLAGHECDDVYELVFDSSAQVQQLATGS